VYYVYLIESLSVQGERYAGMTTDLKQRSKSTTQENPPTLQNSGHGN